MTVFTADFYPPSSPSALTGSPPFTETGPGGYTPPQPFYNQIATPPSNRPPPTNAVSPTTAPPAPSIPSPSYYTSGHNTILVTSPYNPYLPHEGTDIRTATHPFTGSPPRGVFGSTPPTYAPDVLPTNKDTAPASQSNSSLLAAAAIGLVALVVVL